MLDPSRPQLEAECERDLIQSCLIDSLRDRNARSDKNLGLFRQYLDRDGEGRACPAPDSTSALVAI